MQRTTPHQPFALFDTAATRRMEQRCAALLPPHTLMQRAGLAVAQLAQALAPHARCIWIACGPGNNGGDGLEAALQLHQRGMPVVATWLGHPERAPADTLLSWQRAVHAGVRLGPHPPDGLGPADLCIDALLGLGLAPDNAERASPAPDSALLQLLAQLRSSAATLLAVDLPTGLQADTGQYAAGFAPPTPPRNGARHTLGLLTLKPGLFTGAGRDAAGTVWLDDLACTPTDEAPCAWLSGPAAASAPRPHASHKGSYGDVAIIGGEGLRSRGLGMAGAALLAGRAALHSGAGRVLVALLDGGAAEVDAQQPELMFRHAGVLALEQLTVVCGCGGGEAVRPVLPQVLARAAQLVLDADALNAVATDTALQTALAARARQGQATVLTPHPLEAARLLGGTALQVQAHRLAAAQQLADRFGCTVVLKGSGSIVATCGQVPRINPTGNARLATAGTGDVLAGMIGARLAGGAPAPEAAAHAVLAHGWLADQWPTHQSLTADQIARACTAAEPGGPVARTAVKHQKGL